MYGRTSAQNHCTMTAFTRRGSFQLCRLACLLLERRSSEWVVVSDRRFSPSQVWGGRGGRVAAAAVFFFFLAAQINPSPGLEGPVEDGAADAGLVLFWQVD